MNYLVERLISYAQDKEMKKASRLFERMSRRESMMALREHGALNIPITLGEIYPEPKGRISVYSPGCGRTVLITWKECLALIRANYPRKKE